MKKHRGSLADSMFQNLGQRLTSGAFSSSLLQAPAVSAVPLFFFLSSRVRCSLWWWTYFILTSEYVHQSDARRDDAAAAQVSRIAFIFPSCSLVKRVVHAALFCSVVQWTLRAAVDHGVQGCGYDCTSTSYTRDKTTGEVRHSVSSVWRDRRLLYCLGLYSCALMFNAWFHFLEHTIGLEDFAERILG